MANSNNYNDGRAANHHPVGGLQLHPPPPLQHQQIQGGGGTSGGQLHQHHVPLVQPSTSLSSSIPTGNFIGKDASGAYDLGELDQALFLYFDGHEPSSAAQDQRHHHQSSGSMSLRPPTLNIFPSQPMHVDPSPNKGSPNVLVVNSPSSSGSKRVSEPTMELANARAEASLSKPVEPATTIKKEGNRRGATSSSEQDGPKTPDPKTLRRLAQNREAARKSRLRKKAYIQQLESSRIKLTQLEQELQRARSQGIVIGGGGGLLGSEPSHHAGISNANSSEAAMFDMEYARWLEEHHRLTCELRAAVQEHMPDNELRIFVENSLAHYDEMMGLKSIIAKTDVFHLVSGIWRTPAERCFMWMGGIRPSELIKVVLNQIEPLSEQQILGICGLQQSTHEAEEALSQGLEALNQSLSETITSDSLSNTPNMANYMGQMAVAMNKLSAVEGFVRQADNMRHQTIHRLNQLLTTRQSARCLIAIAEYFHRLRALSSLWMSRPRQD